MAWRTDLNTHSANPCITGTSIRLQSLCKSYSRPVLDNISLDLEPGKITALIGRSGCGKTTLLHCLAGLSEVDGGQILPSNLAMQSAVVFQDHRLLPWSSVQDNLLLALQQRKDLTRAEKLGKVGICLDALGLQDYAQALPREISGGMAQRAALGRALLQEPNILLMDEPFAALDAMTRADMHALLLSLHQTHRNSILFVTHDLMEAAFLADRVLLMQDGKVIQDTYITHPHPRDLDSDQLRSIVRDLRRTITHSTEP